MPNTDMPERSSGISPFLPTSAPSSFTSNLIGAGFFLFRFPFIVCYGIVYFLVLDHLPLPQFLRKLLLWVLLGFPGIWWVDLQLDGVKRGSLSQQPASRFPRERAIIAAQFTSPVDAVYLAAIFDPIFVLSFPNTKKVQRISLFRAMTNALSRPKHPQPATGLTTLRALVDANPHRVIAVFPEMTPTNGKGIMPFSPSLLSSPSYANIFPVSLRYTPADITTPVPGAWRAFLWNLLSKPTHALRVRVADGVANTTSDDAAGATDVVDESDLTPDEHKLLDRVAEALARLARNKRVGLTLNDKAAFVDAWAKKRK
ncbi:hypothetical protein F5Y18DRAFT_425948 [Xylariaceae sp. FL1019]|nr:hypothetical protein F5Y18DRAFT_425948 [Xylariaceae sp. FL1019]